MAQFSDNTMGTIDTSLQFTGTVAGMWQEQGQMSNLTATVNCN